MNKTLNAISSVKEAINLITNKATLSVQGLLSFTNFNGWGELSAVFNPKHESHSDLKQAFEDDEAFKVASSTINTSFYTPESVCNLMWQAAIKLGANNGIALDPAAGNARLINAASSDFKGKIYGIELDKISGTIARVTAPHAKIYLNQRFEHCNYEHKGNTTLVISNPPWGNIKPESREFGAGCSIHNYFALKGLDQLHEGGIMVMVVTTWLMDSKNNHFRKMISEKANLLACVRLPDSIFKSSGVNMPSDILIFQKTSSPNQNPNWIKTSLVDNAVINEVFADKTLIAGDLEATKNDLDVCSCHIKNGSIEQASEILLNQIILPVVHSIPQYAKSNTGNNQANQANVNVSLSDDDIFIDLIQPSDAKALNLAVGEICIDLNGKLFRRVEDAVDSDGEIVKTYEIIQVSKTLEKKLKKYIAIKEALKNLLESERNDLQEKEIEINRLKLNQLHANFVKEFGPLSRTANKSKLSLCAKYLSVKALESEYQKADKKEGVKESYQISTIMKKRVYSPTVKPDTAKTYLDAMLISITENCEIKIERVAQLMGVSPEKAKEQLINLELAFEDPRTGKMIDAATYLSGNLRIKLEACANKTGFEKNEIALKKALPKKLSASEIKVHIGATWIPSSIYSEFFGDLLKINRYGGVKIALVDGRYEFSASGYDFVANTSDWGTSRMSLVDYADKLLNNAQIAVFDRINDKSVINQEETVSVNAKADEVREAFNEWIFNDAERREDLVDIYNSTFNVIVAPNYSNLTDGFKVNNCGLNLYEHQKRAVLRALINPTQNIFIDASVGAGKTAVISSIAMMMKEIKGNQSRTLITMPNHLVSQFATAAQAIFPHAQIMTLDEKVSVSKREELLNQIMISDFDMVVMPISTFKMIPAPIETKKLVIQEELDAVRQAMQEAQDNKITVKRIEKKLSNLKSDLQNLTQEENDLKTISFEDLNINQIILDEAQICKNLQINTAMSNVAGLGSVNGSQVAQDMFIKCRHIQDKGGRAIFATGTSILNSITECHTWMKFLARETLEELGIPYIDSFLKNFALPETEFEISCTGRGFKARSRIRKFTNLPEVIRMWRSFAECLSADQLNKVLPNLPNGRTAIPKLKDDKINSIICQPSEIQEKIFDQIVEDAKYLNKQNNMLALMDRARKASLDQRFIEPETYNPNSKVRTASEKIYQKYIETFSFGGTQLVFCDRGISSRHKAQSDDSENNFSVYDDLVSKLIKKGVKENHIAVIHDYDTPIKKIKLQQDMNAGKVRVLIGSTFKMSAGLNVQERLTGISFLDLPLRPGDFTQAVGRILRQGNIAWRDELIDNVEVDIYLTDRTLDSWLLGVLDVKQKFIDEFTKGSLTEREFEAESETISYEELSALVSGNPLMLEHCKLNAKFKKLKSLRNNHRKSTFQSADDKSLHEKKLEQYKTLLPQVTQDIKTLKDDDAPLTLKNGLINPEPADARKYIKDLNIGYGDKGKTFEIATLKGMTLLMTVSNLVMSHNDWNYTVKTSNETSYKLPIRTRSMNGIIEAFTAFCDGFTALPAKISEAIDTTSKSINDCETIMESCFKYENEYQETKNKLKEVAAILASSETQQQAA